VKSIVTVPAFAVSDVLLYFSCPDGSASRLSAAVDGLAGVEVAGVVAGAAGALEAVVGLLEELPQPASTPAAASAASGSEDRRVRRALDVADAVEIKGFLQFSGSSRE
jgi:hypothetical protein